MPNGGARLNSGLDNGKHDSELSGDKLGGVRHCSSELDIGWSDGKLGDSTHANAPAGGDLVSRELNGCELNGGGLYSNQDVG